MKKMIVLLATLMMAMSVSAWAADVAPAKAEAAAPVKAEANKEEAKPAKEHKKSTEKMRGLSQNELDEMRETSRRMNAGQYNAVDRSGPSKVFSR